MALPKRGGETWRFHIAQKIANERRSLRAASPDMPKSVGRLHRPDARITATCWVK